jgi:hypothetical protein
MSNIYNFDISNLKSWTSVDSDGAYELSRLKKMQTRRMTKAARISLDLALLSSEGESIDFIVYASRHGELSLSHDLINSVIAKEIPSPIKFSQSTHNAIAGLYTINTKNVAASTAISSGADSFIMGLISAINFLKSHPSSNVLYVFADAKVPTIYESKLNEPNEDVMLSFVMKSGNSFSIGHNPSGAKNPGELDSLRFLDFILSKDRGCSFSSSNFTIASILR